MTVLNLFGKHHVRAAGIGTLSPWRRRCAIIPS
jgi:hypothetical protein